MNELVTFHVSDQAKTNRELRNLLSEIYFNISIEKHTSRQIALKLNFNRMDLISRGLEKDFVKINVLEPSVFKSKQSGLPVIGIDGGSF